jgi:hypothetical protein
VVTPASGATFQGVVLVGEDPIGFSPIIASPPYRFTIQIPAKITPRKYNLSAVGMLSPGSNVFADGIEIDVERPDPPLSLQVEPSTLAGMDIGDTATLRVVGTFSGNVAMDISQSSKTKYASTNPAIVTVTEDGLVSALRPGSAFITVNNKTRIPVQVQPAVALVPSSNMNYASQTLQFSANTRHNADVFSWSIAPSDLGSISNAGLYSAPASITVKQSVVVTVTDVSQGNATATATLTLYPPISVRVSPAAAAVGPKQSATFTPTVTNDMYTSGVEWSISPSGVGLISPTGVYTAPSALPSGRATVTLTARSITDKTKSASATVQLKK